MNFSETTELLLVRVYEFDKNEPGAQADAGALAKALDITDATVVKDAVWALDERGLVAAIFAAGSPQCVITAEGRLFVEKGGSTEIIKKYLADPAQYIKAVIAPPPPAAPARPAPADAAAPAATPLPPAVPPAPARPLDRQLVEEKLTAMRRLLQKDVNMNEPDKIDAICDIDTLKAHFGRQKPERFLAEPLLARLGKIESVAAAMKEFLPLVRDSF